MKSKNGLCILLKFREMSKIKRSIRVAIILVSIIAGVYLLFSVAYGLVIRTMVLELSQDRESALNKYGAFIDTELLHTLDHSRGYTKENGVDYYDKFDLGLPLVLHDFISGIAIYYYTFERHETVSNKLVGGSWRVSVQVTFKIENFRLIITSTHENP